MLSTKDALIYNVNKKIIQQFPHYLSKSKEILSYLRTLSVSDLTLMLQDNESLKVNFEELKVDVNLLNEAQHLINIPKTVPSTIEISKSRDFSILNLIQQFYSTTITKDSAEINKTKLTDIIQPILFSKTKRLKFALSLWYSPETCDLLADYLLQTLSESELDCAMEDQSVLLERAKLSYSSMNL